MKRIIFGLTIILVASCRTTGSESDLLASNGKPIEISENIIVNVVVTVGNHDMDRVNEVFGYINLKKKKSAGPNLLPEIRLKAIGFNRDKVGQPVRRGEKLRYQFKIPSASVRYYDLAFDLREKDWEYKASSHPFNAPAQMVEGLLYFATGGNNDDEVISYNASLQESKNLKRYTVDFKKKTQLLITTKPDKTVFLSQDDLERKLESVKEELKSHSQMRFDNGTAYYTEKGWYVEMKKILYERAMNRN